MLEKCLFFKEFGFKTKTPYPIILTEIHGGNHCKRVNIKDDMDRNLWDSW